jgi:signal transduction histidine kinase/ligand-binding sensor domain-containing protein
MIVFPVFAQEKPFYFKHLTPENGLSQGHILSLFQDKKGYIWIGTYYGLNRYDGYNFKHYTHSSKDTTSICQDIVYCIFEDKDGFLWLGTVYGLDCFDKKTEVFHHYNIIWGNNSLNDGYIKGITQDKWGNLWIATNNGGLNRIDYKTKKVSYITTRSASPLPSNTINDILYTNDNKLWLATDSGICYLKLPGEKVFRLGEKNKSFSSLCYCRKGFIWTGTKNGELYRIEPTNFMYEQYNYLNTPANSYKFPINDLAIDKTENILIATDGAGLIIYNPLKKRVRRCLHNYNNSRSIASNEIKCILVDKSKTIFAGTYGKGISKYSPSGNKFDTYYITSEKSDLGDNNSFTDCVEARNGKLIIGCYNGFYAFDTVTWEYKHYLPGNNYEDNKILTIVTAPDCTIWMGSNRSIHRYTQDLKKIQSYILIDDKINHPVYTLYFDSKNTLWTALFITEGLFKIPEQEWKNPGKKHLNFKRYRYSWEDTTSLGGDHIWSIKEDHNRNLWIGSNVALSQYNEKKDNFIRHNITGLTKTLFFDNNHKIIITTRGEGFYIYNPITGAQKHYTTEQGLCQNFVFGVLKDKENNLWLTTENGLSKFNTQTGSFRNYDINDGLPGNQFDDRSEKMLPNGKFYIGTTNGFLYFDPHSIIDDTCKANAILTGIKIANMPIQYSYIKKDRNQIKLPIDQLSELILKPSQRQDILFEFAALHYSAPLKNRYKYKLEGFDIEWIETDALNRKARYTNLIEGTYYFKVKASNADGVWNENPYILKVVVFPPFYKSKWFLILLILSTVIIALLLFRWRLNREIKQRLKLAILVDQRTLELKEKNTALETAAIDLNKTNQLLQERQQFIEEQKEELAAQRDELIQLNKTKDKLFSIIAHDLKNPFNILMGFSGLLIQHYKKYDDIRKIHIIELIHQSAQAGYLLLENLLHWSRTQSGNLKFEPAPTSSGKIMELTLPQIKSFADHKNVTIITTHFDSKIEFMADLTMINSVLRNLIMNAIKFSDKGEEINVGVKLKNNNVLFNVSDHGIGITPDEISTLFHIDKTSSKSGTSGEKGTGLGLLICKEFIEKHNGKIWVESEENKGSSFYFELPLKL